MKTKELNKKKAPAVKIDNTLDKYENIVLFPEKLAKANAMLLKKGLPKIKVSTKNHR